MIYNAQRHNCVEHKIENEEEPKWLSEESIHLTNFD